MNILDTNNPLVLRTDYSDDTAWDKLCELRREPVDGFKPYLTFVSDPNFAGFTAEQLLTAPTDAPDRRSAFLVDNVTITHAENPLMVVDLGRAPGQTFRVIPSATGSVAANLDLANVDFDEYLVDVDEDGIFRGYPAMPQLAPKPPPKSLWQSLFGNA